MKKSTTLFIAFFLFVIFLASAPVLAQDEREFKLGLSRDFGYSSGTGLIQGTFSLKVAGPADLVRVEFLIDGEVIGEDIDEPFKLQFHTGDYELGVHTMQAIGYTQDGSPILSNEIRSQFVSPSQGFQSALKIILPLFGIIFGAMLLSFLIPYIRSGGKKQTLSLGAPRSYGPFGGAVCPKCQRPFSRHIWGFNVVVGKLDRCPHCGMWSIVRAAPIEILRAAEAAELETAQDHQHTVSSLSEDEKLRREIDESRYQDL